MTHPDPAEDDGPRHDDHDAAPDDLGGFLADEMCQDRPARYSALCLAGQHMDCRDARCTCRLGTHAHH